jgi:hypothetical protein
MALTPTTFRARYPEFASAPDPLLQVFLDDALTRIDTTVWGLKADMGQGLLTAHLLAIAPNGQYSRLQTDKGSTTSWVEYDKLVKEVSSMIRIFF